MNKQDAKILLGIDTGGTYTDAVLLTREQGVLEKAKSLTSHHDLSIGISGSIEAVLNAGSVSPQDISLVSVSTTLATNALVEGKGRSVALIMIGFDEADVEKAGLKAALGDDPVLFIAGGHDVQGNARPLDLEPVLPFISEVRDKVSGFAVAGYFAVRNASHELEVKSLIQDSTELPVTCSHELSSKLGGPKRALTTLLNARLIPVIRSLVTSCEQHLDKVGIRAPLMVVRGDGTLVSAEFASSRPIETILSGPAASLIGAQFLLGTQDAVVSDIGGTTTDVAILEKGWPRIEPEGASVGGKVTMVEAVAMHTFGLGGDSEVTIDDDQPFKFRLGPRRNIPVSLLAMQYPDIVSRELKRQEKIDNPTILCGRFVLKARQIPDKYLNLKTSEAKLYARITDQPQALDTCLRGASDANTLNNLLSRGLVSIAGFTPSDAMHVLGEQDNWDMAAAKMTAGIVCRMRDKFGKAIASGTEELCRNVKCQLVNQSAEVILSACMKENGLTLGPGGNSLLARALERASGLVRFSVSLDRPLVGLGASAAAYYPEIGKRLNSDYHIPEHADVANAIGAVTSKVRIIRSVEVTSPDGGSSFQIMGQGRPMRLKDESEALTMAEELLHKEVGSLAQEAGGQGFVFETKREIQAPEIEGARHFVQAKIVITAIGEPRIHATG